MERQVDSKVGALTQTIKALQKTEERRESHLNSVTSQKRMSEHFAQAVLFMSIM